MRALRKKKEIAKTFGVSISRVTNHIPEQKYQIISATLLRSEIIGDSPISLRTKIYFQERLRQRLYDMVMHQYDIYKESGKTRLQLAVRLGKRPEQITRWLSEPGNLTFDTLSDLLLGLTGGELSMRVDYPATQPKRLPRFPQNLLNAKKNSPACKTRLIKYGIGGNGLGYTRKTVANVVSFPLGSNELITTEIF